MIKFPCISNNRKSIASLVVITLFVLNLSAVKAQNESPAFETLNFINTERNEAAEMKSADIDNDGKPDIIVCYKFSNTVQIFLNSFNNTNDLKTAFIKPSDFYFESGFGAKIVIADLNKDQLPEILLTHKENSDITIFQNTSVKGKVNFLSPVNIHFEEKPIGISSCDFNNDGMSDLIIAFKNKINVLENTASAKSDTPSFENKKELKSSDIIYDIKCADMDGDGNADIVAGLSDGIAIYKNTITSSSKNISMAAAKYFKTGCTIYAFDIGDIDNDFKPDIASVNWPDANITLLPNISANGEIKFAEPMHIESGAAQHIALGDLNQDGKFEITTVSSGGNLNITEVFKNVSKSEGDFNFIPYKNFNAFATNPVIQDFDRDGFEDLAGINSSSSSLEIITVNKNNKSILYPAPEVFCDESGQTTIQWESTLTENVISYTIEKSYDGKLFNSISEGDVKSGKDFYSFVDTNAKGDIAYYRLKINNAETTKYSDITISNPCSNIITEFICAYPNPADKTMNFKFSISSALTMHYVLMDLNMQPQLEKTEQVSAGTRTYSLDISQLLKGSYIFVVYFGNLPPKVCRFEKL